MEQKETDLQKILDDYEKQEFLVKKKQEGLKKQKEKKEKFRLILDALGVVFIILLTGKLLLSIFVDSGFLKGPQYWAVGGLPADRQKTHECIFKLWNIRKAIDFYFVMFKEFPESFEDLDQEGLFPIKKSCSLSTKEYVFFNQNGRREICCPVSQAHGVQAICLGVESGPPLIKR